MAANVHTITSEVIELLGFLRQNIVRKLEEEALVQGRPKTHPWVVQAVVRHFNLRPVPHQVFDRLVWRIAHSYKGESRGFGLCHPTVEVLCRSAFTKGL